MNRRTDRRPDNVTARPDPAAEAPTARLRFGLLAKLVLFIAAGLILLGTAAWTISVQTLRHSLTEEFTSKGAAIANSLASSSVDLILTRDASTVQALVDQFAAIRGVAYVMVYNPEKTLIAHTFSPRVPRGIVEKNLVTGEVAQQVQEIRYPDPVTGAEKQIIDVGVPMLGGQLGTVRVGMNRAIVDAATARAGQFILLAFGGVAVVAVVAAVLFARRLTKPVVHLVSAARRIGQGDLSELVPVTSRDEIGQLAATFNESVVRLRSLVKTEAERDELTRSVEGLTALGEVGQAVSSTLDLQEVLTTIVTHAVRLSTTEGGTIYEFDPGEEVFVPRANYGITGELVESLRESRLRIGDESVVGQAAERRTPVQIPDLVDTPRYPLPFLVKAGFRALLAVPLIREARIVGMLVVRRHAPGEFHEPVVDLLQTFAAQSVLAIQNARLFQEIDQKSRELESLSRNMEQLYRLSTALQEPLSLGEQLTRVLDAARQVVRLDRLYTWTLTPEADGLAIIAQAGFTERDWQELEGVTIPLHEAGALAAACQQVAPLLFTEQNPLPPGLRLRPPYSDLLGLRVKSFLVVPMIARGRPVGVLAADNLVSREPIPPQTVDLLQTFAAQAAVAVENARLFQEIQDKSRELEVASRHKSEFLANMSHELRTPLNAIIGYSEMLQEEAADQGEGRFVADLQRINAAGRHLLELINAVLDLSKIEAGKMDLYLETFGIATLVHDVAAVIRPLAEKNANRLEIRCDEDAGSMRADLTKVRQALFNLLSNACKFTDHGTVSLAVVREATETGDWVAFAVRDTGIGLTPDQMAKLFQEFSQADAATTRKYGGTGLGLSLSQRLCRMMGGDIRATSEPGAGSTFTIRLPATVIDPRAESVTPAPAEGAPAGASTVLVIDDEPAVRDLMQRFLGREGFRVVAAPSGEEGLRLAKELLPDAITLDVMMPGLDGWAVLSALKADPDLADIPVVMLTIVDDRNLGYALGAADYLTKPLDRERLVAVLNRYQRDLPVLVVDDDEGLRELIRRILEREGYRVVEAENGRAALARIREAPPGVILLDLMMPEMDGFEFVAEFRTQEAWRGIPIIVITAKDLTPEDHQRLTGYVERILQKGVESREALLHEVRELVAACVTRRRGTR